MTLPQPPRAEPRPQTHERFGVRWRDDWAWLRDAAYPELRDPAIRAYLEAENAYLEAVMEPHEALIGDLRAELEGRIEQDEASVPVRDGRFEYHWRFAPGAQYRTWYRRAIDAAEPEPVLDEVALARGKAFFGLRAFAPDPEGRLLAFAADEDGSERCWLAVRDMATGAQLGQRIGNTSGQCVWDAEGGTLFYVELSESLRPFRVRAHRTGEEPAADRIVWEEKDPAFFVSLTRTRDRRFVVITSGTHVTTELAVLPAGRPEALPRVVAARREGRRCSLDHAHDRFWIVTNDTHENFRLVSVPDGEAPDREASDREAPDRQAGEAGWREELPGSDELYLLGVDCFEDFLALSLRTGGLSGIRVQDYGRGGRLLAFPEEVCTVAVGDNREFRTDRLRVRYSSMVSPASVIDCVVATGELIVRKVRKIPSGYDKARYVTRRLTAPAADGTAVPVTLVHRDDYPLDGTGRLLLYGYGAYGMGLDPAFSPHRLSLLDRGFCFAIAHVRGGDELGWRWYREGKLESKENTFGDFIACAEALVRAGYAQPGEIAIRGGSAGGMLMGVVANRRPDLWKCVVAEVPFVDVLNTMLDASLPLTPIEWPEWGDPLTDRAAFERILGYSPYDNIRPQAYPPMLVTAGVSDPRVTYWEPAKLVARLRATRTDDNLLLLKTNMGAGHFGKSGRFDALGDLAEQYAFVLRCFGLA